ncbi:MAG: GNAT family N-acetyltransferase [Patescibacteria group bacterium]
MNLNLRPATSADAERLLAWRNDLVTRQSSINTDPVSLENHLAWLAKILREDESAPTRQLFIAEEVGTPVGTVRLDWASDRKAVELSWTIAPEARGRGLGQAMVEAATELPAVRGKQVLAKVKPENVASMKIVANLGFTRLPDDPLGLTEWLIQK